MEKFFDGLRLTVLSAVSEIHISDILGSPLGWSNKHVHILRELLSTEVVCEADLHQAVHGRLCEMGRASYDEHRAGEHPDHTRSPEAFAYALLHNVFTPREEYRIRFDHGDTKESFIRSYENNIRERVVKALLTERAAPSLSVRDTDLCCHH